MKGTESWKDFSEAVGQKWSDLGGVPHLAKQYDQLEGIFESIRCVSLKKMYGLFLQNTEFSRCVKCFLKVFDKKIYAVLRLT